MIPGLLFHTLAAVLWVGGMLFAHFMLRPSLAVLDRPARLALWRRVFTRFFPAVWAAIVVLLLSGYGMISALGGFASIGTYVNVMQAGGIVMMLAFAHLYFAPWKRFRRAVDAGDLDAAAGQLAQIRRIVTFNLALGVVVIVVGATGRYWG